MPDRFNLEQALMDCWHTADDIEQILKSLESDTPPSSGSLIFLLRGLKEMHELRSAQAFEIFESLCGDLPVDNPLPTHSPSVKQNWATDDFNNKKPTPDYRCYKNCLAQNRDYKN